jgi:hypothetical protein
VQPGPQSGPHAAGQHGASQHGGGQHGAPQPQFMFRLHGGQQPVQQKLPQQHGLKALYGLQQMVQQHFSQQQWSKNQAEAWLAPRVSTPRLTRAAASSLFMVGPFSLS